MGNVQLVAWSAADAEVDLTRHVATPAGVKRYNKPIGTPLGGGKSSQAKQIDHLVSHAKKVGWKKAVESQRPTKATHPSKGKTAGPKIPKGIQKQKTLAKQVVTHQTRSPNNTPKGGSVAAGFVQVQKPTVRKRDLWGERPYAEPKTKTLPKMSREEQLRRSQEFQDAQAKKAGVKVTPAPKKPSVKKAGRTPQIWQTDARALGIMLKSNLIPDEKKTEIRIELARRAAVAKAIIEKRAEISKVIDAHANPDGTIKDPSLLFKALYKLVPKMKEPMEALRANKVTQSLSKRAKRIKEGEVTKATIEAAVDFIIKLGASALLLHFGIIASPIA